MIIIESKRKKPETILKKYPDAILADVTSGAKDGLVKLSPFYPHGGIPVPFSEGFTATCVEAIWQGLKVFEGCDVDTSLFANDTMKGLKRTVRKYGKPLGHRKGVNGTELLGHIEVQDLLKENQSPAAEFNVGLVTAFSAIVHEPVDFENMQKSMQKDSETMQKTI